MTTRTVKVTTTIRTEATMTKAELYLLLRKAMPEFTGDVTIKFADFINEARGSDDVIWFQDTQTEEVLK